MLISQLLWILQGQKGPKFSYFLLILPFFPSFLAFLALHDDLNQLLSNFMMRHEIWVLLTPITLP